MTLVDGRQSDAAAAIARGARRLMRSLGLSTVTELGLRDGRRADIVGLAPDGELWIVEVKSCPADFRADHKWRDYSAHCDRLYFAISDATPPQIMPEDAGLILADRFGAAILREADKRPLAPATRRAMMLRFATVAADRLHRLVDPEF